MAVNCFGARFFVWLLLRLSFYAQFTYDSLSTYD